jgi:hypothetical protein
MRPAPFLAGLAALLLGACHSELKPPTGLATYRAPDIPPECREAVYSDPKVRETMIANSGVPALIGDNQNKLAFLQADAVQRCLQAKGRITEGGVEPIRYKWYPSPF